MAASSRDASLRVLRGLISELRQIKQNNSNVRDMSAYQHVISQFRRFQVTDEKLCRGREEVKHLGQVYLCYLRSSRRRKELHEDYRSRGERSIEEAAGLVGLRLPKLYKETTSTVDSADKEDK